MAAALRGEVVKMNINQVIEVAKGLDLKYVRSADRIWTIEKFSELVVWYEGDYGIYNDPAGARIDRHDHEGGCTHGCYYLYYDRVKAEREADVNFGVEEGKGSNL